MEAQLLGIITPDPGAAGQVRKIAQASLVALSSALVVHTFAGARDILDVVRVESLTNRTSDTVIYRGFLPRSFQGARCDIRRGQNRTRCRQSSEHLATA